MTVRWDGRKDATPRSPEDGRIRWSASIRVRLLAWFMILLTLASAASVLVVRQILLNRSDERIDRELVQEARELAALARGNDPATGEPFGGRVRKIFATFLERSIPNRHEALITFVDGEPFLRSRQADPYRLDHDPDLVARWASTTETDRGVVETPAGAVEFLAVPIRAEDRDPGVFVVAIFRDRLRAETDTAIAGAAGTGVVILFIGSLLAWRLADRILSPVSEVRRTAQAISESDLTRRIEVEGKDEISALALTFNQMLDRLENAFQVQKDFIDDAGHELRTPITIIRGHLETIESDPEERAKTIALVLDELERMNRLVEDLLVLARAERPDLLNLDLVDVSSLTKDVHSKASALGAREWRLGEIARGRIVADGQRLTQALIQLVLNAFQSTAPDDRIELGSRLDGDFVRFWVADSGPGIPAADRSRIFERFARGDAARRRDGSGLGLSIVRAIVDAHGGRVVVESEVGAGSTFSLIIPADQRLPEPEEVKA